MEGCTEIRTYWDVPVLNQVKFQKVQYSWVILDTALMI